MRELIKEALEQLFYRNPAVRNQLPNMERQVANGEIPPTAAVTELLRLFAGS